MTTTTPTNPAAVDPLIDVCQFETEPFLDLELDAIGEYCETVSGIPDCFSDIGTGWIADVAADDPDGVPGALDVARDYYRMLRTWRDALDALHTRLLACGCGQLTTAADRYYSLEASSWRAARAQIDAAAITHLLGRDEDGYTYAVADNLP